MRQWCSSRPTAAILAALLICLWHDASGASVAKRTMHPAFENAGIRDGLKIWRVENFEPVPYPEKDYGKFYSGDSYIVLFTKEDKKAKKFNWDIHYWLGNQTSQDEAGAAAILSVQLDDQLGGGPVQHREVQEHESQQFLGYFKSGVRYVPGGVASGFKHVDINAPVEKALYQVKGKRNVRVRQVEAKVTSMNKGDCFILDSGRDIYVYVGAKAKGSEKVKATEAANLIRDQDHSGRGKVYIVDASATPDEVNDFFKMLGGGSPSQVADEPKTDDDQEFERKQDGSVALYKISDASGQVTSVKIAEKPLKQEMLDTNDAFILDTVSSGIYVWVGKKSTVQEKVEALKNAQAFLAEKKYPSWTKITRVVENSEPAGFREYFFTWSNNAGRPGSPGNSPVRNRGRRSVLYNCDPATGFMPDDGSGEKEIYRVENFELVPVDSGTYGKFFGGDSYVIKYKYYDGGREKYIIYFWQGKDSTHDEKAASAIHAQRLDGELGGKAVQIRVTQGHEPTHFLRLFKGNMIVFLGGKASGFRNLRDHDTYDVDGTRLFQVRGSCKDDVHAVQVPEKYSSLASNHAYVLETPGTTFLWLGKDCPPEIEDLVEDVTSLVAPGHSVTTMTEGDEPEDFWEALGGQGSYQPTRQQTFRPARAIKLFHCYVPYANKLKVEEITHFSQQDLFNDDVMVMDSGDLIYVWVGDQATEEERRMAIQMAEEYLERDTSDRPEDTVVVVIKQGEEPQSFRNLFPEWDQDMWTNSETYEDLKRRITESNRGIIEDAGDIDEEMDFDKK